MASVYDLKPAFQRLLRPIVGRLAKSGVTPNAVTIFALGLSIAVGGTIAFYSQQRWPLLLLPATLFVRMALNAIDGMLARDHDMISPAGGLLNELGDVVSDAALYLPLAFVPGFDPRWIVLAVVLAGLTETAGLAAVGIGASRRYDGPMGKSDRAAAFGLLGLILGLGAATGWWLDAVLIVVCLLSILTIVRRCQRAVDEAEGGRT